MKKIANILIVIALLYSCASAQTVVFNTKTLKYHKPTCVHAKKCTLNCIKIEKSKAQAKGGKPCKSCGG